MREKYVVNGVQYDRFDDVPDRYKRQIIKMRAFGDEQSELGEIESEVIDSDATTTEIETITHTTVGAPTVAIEVDGNPASLDDVPPMIRKRVERMLEDKDGDGVPDAVQHLMARPEPKNANPFDAPPRARTPKAMPDVVPRTDDDRYVSRRTLIASVAALVLIALAVGYWLGT